MRFASGDTRGPLRWPGKIRRLGLLVLGLGLAAGCGSNLNPSFVASLGISPIPGLGAQPGSVVVLLINNTAFAAEMRVRFFESEGYQSVSRLTAAANESVIIAADCEITQITFESLTVTMTTDAGGTQEEAVEVPTTPLVGGVNFTCGRVVVATVSGTAQNFELTTQVG